MTSKLITRIHRNPVLKKKKKSVVNGSKISEMITRLHRNSVRQIARKAGKIGVEIGKMITRIRCNLVRQNGENRSVFLILRIRNTGVKKPAYKNTLRTNARAY